MKTIKDPREYSGHLYDLGEAIDDIEFYRALISKSINNVLELGCGTGRVFIPLAKQGVNITGIDYSQSMLNECLCKIRGARLRNTKVVLGDIRDFQLYDSFDMIIAPFRVVQNLETIQDLQKCLLCIKKHLSAKGFCILNVFHPYLTKEEMGKSWVRKGETFGWEKIDPETGYRIRFFDERRKIDAISQVIYPVMIYRIYNGNKLVDEIKQDIVMKYYYPEEFESIIVHAGFEIQEKYGGYHGEKYGEGNELVIKFVQQGPYEI